MLNSPKMAPAPDFVLKGLQGLGPGMATLLKEGLVKNETANIWEYEPPSQRSCTFDNGCSTVILLGSLFYVGVFIALILKFEPLCPCKLFRDVLTVPSAFQYTQYGL